MKRSALTVGLLLTLAGSTATQQNTSFDLLVRGGRVLDGTGNPWFRADIGVRDGRIVAVGLLDQAFFSTSLVLISSKNF